MSEPPGTWLAASAPMALALVPSVPRSRRGPRLRRIALDPGEAAGAAQLRYRLHARPGPAADPPPAVLSLYRNRRRAGERPRHAAANPSLAIPPAWTEVWICPVAHGHISRRWAATRAGRKQYRYHAAVAGGPRRGEVRPRHASSGRRAARRSRERGGERPGSPGPAAGKVLASVVRLLETSLIRIGNVEYARGEPPYGLTTLRTRHVTVEARGSAFEFRGKAAPHRGR